jgi:hypothetical protein
MTVCRGYEQRIWRPLWLWMLDVCLVNSFLIWKGVVTDESCRGHRKYRKALCQALLEYSDDSIPAVHLPPKVYKASEHTWSHFGKRNYCFYCKTHKKEWVPEKPAGARRFGTDITNTVSQASCIRGSMTWGGCRACGVYLCDRKGCMKLYDHRNGGR